MQHNEWDIYRNVEAEVPYITLQCVANLFVF